jgi:hypothetical protein
MLPRTQDKIFKTVLHIILEYKANVNHCILEKSSVLHAESHGYKITRDCIE